MYVLNSDIFQSKLNKAKGGATLQQFTIKQIKTFKIPLPPLAIQKQLVAEAEKEEEIIKANKRLIEIMEKKIEKVIAEI